MSRYIVGRLLYGLLVLLGVLLVVFLIFNVLPADPTKQMLGQRADAKSVAAINKELGRDRPLWFQFFVYLNDVSPVSFHKISDEAGPLKWDDKKYSGALVFKGKNKGLALKFPYLNRSYQSKKKVSDILVETLPETTVLALTAMVIATIWGIAFGTFAALYKNKLADHLLMFLSIIGTSVPSFFAAILIAWFFGFLLHNYTSLNMTGTLREIEPFTGQHYVWKNLILPAFALGIRPLAIVTQLSRGAMLDVLSKDYIRTARAKGLSKAQVVWRHALKNSLNPVVTAISGWFASLMAGAFFIEYIFGWNGIGKVTVEALDRYDLPVVMGAVLYVATFFILINILVDVLYGLLDPRVRIN